MHRLNQCGILRVNLNSFPQLRDMLVEGAAIGHVFQTPAFIEKLIPRNRFARMTMQQLEHANIPQAKVLRSSAGNGESIWQVREAD